MARDSPSSPKSPKSPKSPNSPVTGAPVSAQSPGTSVISPAPLTVPGNVLLEADDYGDDNDGSSVYGGAGSDTTSIMSSVLRYRYENGRTYHSYKANEGVSYFLPNDDRENERLDLQHTIWLMTQGGELYLCPAGKNGSPLRRVLDVGTGTGIWSMEMGDKYPETSILGNDLSLIQPEFVPPNVEFFIDDVEAEWTYHSPFDFIYVRTMTGSIKDWPKLFRQSYENLNPGGWIEVCDLVNPLTSADGTLTKDSKLLEWNRLLVEASKKLGSPLNSALNYKQQLKDAGFVNIVQHEFKWPSNDWPKDKDAKQLGAWVYENFCGGLEGISLMLLSKVLGWSVEEVQVFLVDVRKEFANRNIHAFWDVYVVYGQKPE